jgi:hypothetical protein
MLGHDRAHLHGHRPGRTRYLCRRTAKYGREEAHGNGAEKSRDWAGTRGDTEGQGQWQRENGGRNVAKKMSPRTELTEYDNGCPLRNCEEIKLWYLIS